MTGNFSAATAFLTTTTAGQEPNYTKVHAMNTTTIELQPVTDATFAAEVEGAPGLVLVDFWAVWCGPCQMVGPTLKQLAAERAGTLKVVKLDADENQRTVARFGVRGLPTMMLFKDGKPVAQIVGAVPKGKIEAVLDQHI